MRIPFSFIAGDRAGTIAIADAELATSDATPTSMGATFAIPTNTIVTVDAQFSCINDGATGSQVFNVRREFLNAAGVITASAQANTAGPFAIGDVIGASITIEYTGTTGRTEVTGVAGTGLRWRMDRQITTAHA